MLDILVMGDDVVLKSLVEIDLVGYWVVYGGMDYVEVILIMLEV